MDRSSAVGLFLAPFFLIWLFGYIIYIIVQSQFLIMASILFTLRLYPILKRHIALIRIAYSVTAEIEKNILLLEATKKEISNLERKNKIIHNELFKYNTLFKDGLVSKEELSQIMHQKQDIVDEIKKLQIKKAELETNIENMKQSEEIKFIETVEKKTDNYKFYRFRITLSIILFVIIGFILYHVADKALEFPKLFRNDLDPIFVAAFILTYTLAVVMYPKLKFTKNEDKQFKFLYQKHKKATEKEFGFKAMGIKGFKSLFSSWRQIF